MADITLREATPIDFADVAAMHYRVWRQSWAGVLPAHVLDALTSPKRWAVLLYPRDLSRPGWRMWIAESSGQLLGMTIFGPDPDDPERLQLDALYISPESQRHGIGGLLLAKVLDCDPGCDVVLWCAEANAAARRFYEKNDFHPDGRTLNWEPAPGVKVPHLGYRLRRR
ncbi:GNAT family N-acetyltransferase [Mycobacterium sp. 1465703.0]|uniref:GNAT family N-acetyltransferase n=1 Tax=Mycobacterium sp. 1465703.0 TaxID=1834078 RepID=UPI0007FDED57|nr:GNAT family N-acetyltransferase [Mycobacterium sp. 1465703.0]OBJ02556.1 GNAT family acetyltransferase [Mycobacterium sp. 1465703.0]